MNENELMHHGILHMKWGVRRYENEDGTLTEAGKARYRTARDKDGKLKYVKLNSQNASNDELKTLNARLALEGKASKSQYGVDIIRNTGDAATKSANLIRKHKKVDTPDTSNLSDAELQKIVNRMNLEANYARLTSQNTKTGADKVADILDTVGDVASVAASGALVVIALKKAMG